MINTKILPPANGKKLWRVKNRNPSQHESNTFACLQNSLKITSSGTKFTVKKPQLKRPKNKPGCKKDFVFVDLSPVKGEEEKAKTVLPASPVSSIHSEDSFLTENGSNSDISSIFDSQNYVLAEPFEPNLTHDNLNIDELINQVPSLIASKADTFYNSPSSSQSEVSSNVPSTPVQTHSNQFETPVNQILKTPEVLRSNSTNSINFTSYPSSTPVFNAKTQRIGSQPIRSGDLDTFLNLNNQFESSLYDNKLIENDEFLSNYNLELMDCDLQEFLNSNNEFDAPKF